MNEDLKNLLTAFPEAIFVYDDALREIVFENTEFVRLMGFEDCNLKKKQQII